MSAETKKKVFQQLKQQLKCVMGNQDKKIEKTLFVLLASMTYKSETFD